MNKQFMRIDTLGDLVYLVNHNSKNLDQRIKRLVRRSQNLKSLCAIALGCAIYTAIKCRKQDEQVYQLSVRVKKLEHDEEE